MATTIQMINGNFQDAEGNVLANGTLVFELSQDCIVSGVGQICAGKKISYSLDANGNIVANSYIWPNDAMSPANNYYLISGYTSTGQLAWGPNAQQITGTSPFDLNTWVPNTLTNWNPANTGLVLETNGTRNGSQTLLNLNQGSNITLTDDGVGGVTVAGVTQPQVQYIGKTTVKWYQDPNNSSVLMRVDGSGNTGTSVTVSPVGLAAVGTVPVMARFTSSSSAPTSSQGWTSNGAAINLRLLARASFFVRLNQTAGTRYWFAFGLGATVIAGNPFVANNPNLNCIGFRYSPGVDTTIKAYCGQTSTIYTVLDTGVAPDTVSPQLLEFTWDGTKYDFYINSVHVGAISTNLPALTNIFNWLTAMDTLGVASTASTFDFCYVNVIFTY